jgi:acyl-CoA thioesterase-1
MCARVGNLGQAPDFDHALANIPSIYDDMEKMRGLAISLFLLSLCVACRRSTEPAAETPSAPPVQEQPAQPADDRPLIVAFGDSLTAGLGVDPGHSYPDYLQRLIDEKGYRYRVVNAGVSGDTSSGGLTRLSSILAMKPEIVILELGANDGLRGLPVEQTRANLEEMVATMQQAGVTVVLLGMTLPRNYGPHYIESFEKIYKDIARVYKLVFIPFDIDTFVKNPGLMQRDGLHPTAEGYAKITPRIFSHLEPLLK